MALFRNVGPDQKDDIVYFFGDAAMCDKMIGHHLRTSHGCLTLSDVTRVQLRQEEGGGGGRAIALQTGIGKHVKEMVIVPEEQREFLSWTRHIKVRGKSGGRFCTWSYMGVSWPKQGQSCVMMSFLIGEGPAQKLSRHLS